MKRNQESLPHSDQKKKKVLDDATQENEEPTSSSAMADEKQSPSKGKEIRKEIQLEMTTMSKFTQSPISKTKSLESRVLSNIQQENSQTTGDMGTHKMSPPVDTDDPDWVSSKISTPPELEIENPLQSDIHKSLQSDIHNLPSVLELQTGQKFIVNGKFGEGVFGIVYFVRGEDNKDYAAKVIKERNRVYLAIPEEEAYEKIAANPHKNLLLLHLKGLLINPPPTCTQKVFITPACGPSLLDVYNRPGVVPAPMPLPDQLPYPSIHQQQQILANQFQQWSGANQYASTSSGQQFGGFGGFPDFEPQFGISHSIN
ncbi:hypothetical protein L3Y34_011416 [Caenorhabditis briggsae]|uniref:Protein kinase domain-containing protein n=1 Tax=Caenorhabditis briggsae TaxID=6238 RepID=A0AAE8ZLM3_CAEBR|nr:hypothetical protein L3Y34_011416 [Caenorhabditis briggsae]